MLIALKRKTKGMMTGVAFAYALAVGVPVVRVVAVTACAYALTVGTQANAQEIPEEIDVAGGTDQSENLGALNNMGATIIRFLINVVARVIGVGLGIYGIMQFVKREVVWGVVTVCLCGVCFFLPQIIMGLRNMGG